MISLYLNWSFRLSSTVSHHSFPDLDEPLDELPDKPEKFEEMKQLARLLSKNIPHVRIDFYIIDNKIYFGEFTFYHNCGFMSIQPSEWDNRIGSLINI